MTNNPNNKPDSELDVGSFLKKYMDADDKGDMVLIGGASYDLTRLIDGSTRKAVIEELTRMYNMEYLRVILDGTQGKKMQVYPRKWIKNRLQTLKEELTKLY